MSLAETRRKFQISMVFLSVFCRDYSRDGHADSVGPVSPNGIAFRKTPYF